MIKLDDAKKIKIGNFKYDKILSFWGEKCTIAVLNGKAGLIDYNGNQLTEFIYDDLSDDLDDFFEEVCLDIGYMPFGHKESKTWSTHSGVIMNEKYCSMRLNGKWGLLDEKGQTIIDFKYSNPVIDWGDNFIIETNKDIMGIEVSDYFIMDKNKKIHVDLNFMGICPQGEFAVVVKNGKWGIIDKNLNTIINCKYRHLYIDKRDKYILAENDDHKIGVIDFGENIIIDFLYSNIIICYLENQKKYLFRAKYNGKYALFNENAEQIA